MKKLFLIVAGVTLASACSDRGDRPTPVADDNLTRPLEVARVDTTQPSAPVEREVIQPVEEVSKPTEPVTRPKPRKAKPQARKPAPPQQPATAVAPPQEDTTIRGYAPDTNVTSFPDSAPAPVLDTAATLARDTGAVAGDTASRPVPDTVTVATIETAPTPDTVSTSDTAAAPDTTLIPATASTAVTDSMVGRDRSSVPASPSAASIRAARTLPIGTEVHAALDDSINSRTDSVGRVVTAVVMENVTGSDGKTLIAAGSPVRFTVTRLSAARSKSAQGRLALQVDGIGMGGELRKVSADVRPIPHELRGRGVGTSEAAKVGVGAAGGAVIGRVLGGNTKGAVIGGVVGAAGGAVVASQTASRDVVVQAKTPVVMVLTQPLVAP